MEPLSNFLTEEQANQQQALLQTIQEALSSAREINANFEASLSSIPVHPYDAYKQQYLETDYTPITLEQIQAPVNFCPSTCLREISAISQDFFNNSLVQINALTAENMPIECNAFAVLSATENGDEFVVDSKRVANYLKLLDTIRSIPLEAIERNPGETARKIITQYIQMLKVSA